MVRARNLAAWRRELTVRRRHRSVEANAGRHQRHGVRREQQLELQRGGRAVQRCAGADGSREAGDVH